MRFGRLITDYGDADISWEEVDRVTVVFTDEKGTEARDTFNIEYKVRRCLSGDTLITMVEYEEEEYEDEKGKKKKRKVRRIIKKRIDEVKAGDLVLAYNPETNEYEDDKVSSTGAKENKEFMSYHKWIFEDGTVLKIVYKHRFYNVEHQSYMYMDEWNLGEHGYNEKGEKVALVKHEEINESINYYTIYTEKHNNYFANGLLSGNRYSKDAKLG